MSLLVSVLEVWEVSGAFCETLINETLICWIYLLVVELFSPVRVLVWTTENVRTQRPDERSQQNVLRAFLSVQLSQVQVIAL